MTSAMTTTEIIRNTSSIFESYDSFILPHWKQFDPVPDYWHYIIGVYITIVGLTGVFGNATVIWIFSTTPSLKTPSNMLIINLALSDFMFSLVNGFPMISLSAFYKRWIWGNEACVFSGFIGGLFGLMSINTLAAISIDRYINIAYPLSSVRFMTRKNSLVMIGVVWVWSLAWSVPPVFGWGAYVPEGFQTSCTFDYISDDAGVRSHIFGMYIGSFALPLAIIITCYVMILKAIKQHEKEMTKIAKKLKAEDIRANKEKARAEIRVAKIAMGIVFLYLMSWSPYAVVALIGQFGQKQLVNPYVSELPVMLAKTCAMHNPIVYALSHPKFRDALYRRAPLFAICCKPPKRTTSLASDSGNRTFRQRSKANRMTSDATTEPCNTDSETSCVSDIEDSVFGHNIQMNRSVSEIVPNGDYGDVVRELVRALVGVACSQPFLQPIYMSDIPSPTTENSGIPNQGFSNSNGEISSYLSNLISTRQTGSNDSSNKTNTEQEVTQCSMSNRDYRTDQLESNI